MSSDATDNTMRAELLPCPFCGGECSVSKHEYGYWRGWCDPCEMEGPPADKEAVAIAAWNRRADTARQVAEAVEAEREACAALCDEQSHEPECPERAEYCAAAIRARSTPPTDASQ